MVPLQPKHTLAMIFMLMSALLAGCLGGEDLDGTDDDSGPQEGLATVTGSIFTISLDPIDNAQVRLFQGEEMAAEATTDNQGRYEIRNVEPGEYRLQATAPCCREDVRRVTVTEDEVVTIDLRLEPFTADDLQTPRVERFQWRGFLACTVTWPTGGVAPYSGANACGIVEIFADNATDDDFLHEFTIGPGLKSVVGGAEWRAPGASLGDELRILMEQRDRPNEAPRYASVEGHSPLEFRADAGYVIEEYDEEIDDHNIHQYDFDNVESSLELMFRIFAGGDLNIVYQQQFTLYYNLYYWEAAPEDATAIPDL